MSTDAERIRSLTREIDSLDRDMREHSRRASRGVSVYRTPGGDRRYERLMAASQRLWEQRAALQQAHQSRTGEWLGTNGEQEPWDEDEYDSSNWEDDE